MTTPRRADALFPPGTRMRAGSPHRAQTITCHECRAEEVLFFARNPLPFAGMASHFAAKGWRVKKNGRHLCEKCLRGKPKQKEDTMNHPQKAVAQAVSSDAREARRMAHMMIEEKYDVASGRYRDGYSDDRIAGEFKLSVDWVARRREEEFGPIKEDPVQAAFQSKLVDAEQALGKAAEAVAVARDAVKRIGDVLRGAK